MIFHLKKLIHLSSLLFVLSFATACEKESLSNESDNLRPALEVTNTEEGCQQIGLQYAFDLDVVVAGDPGSSMIPIGKSYFLSKTTTPQYQLSKDCVCHIKYYDISFDWLPPASDIEVTDMGGNPMQFLGPTIIGGIPHIEIHPLFLTTEFLIGFSPSTSPKPLLVDGGGFCIVDNISGPKDGKYRTSPFIEPGFDPLHELPVDNIFIPVSATSYLIP